jgi:prepilin-type N-terminal cleavage/methylation domain-containing protein
MPRIQRRGFTLIELLVVVAIIALLVGILLPALQSARDSARSVICVSNLRTLAITIQQYADEHQGNLPKSSHSAGFNALPWAATLYEPLTGRPFEGASYSWDDAGWWNATNTHYRCPHDRRESPIAQPGLPFSLPALSYGFNVYFELTPPEIDPSKPLLSSRATYAKLASIPRPSGTVLMGELVDSASRDHIMAHFWRTSGVAPESEVAMHRHHDAGSGYAWLDGHTSTDAFSETYDPANTIDRWNPGDRKLFINTSSSIHP